MYRFALLAAAMLLSICNARADSTVTYSGTLKSVSYYGEAFNGMGIVTVVFFACDTACGTYNMTVSEAEAQYPYVGDEFFNAKVSFSNGLSDQVAGLGTGSLAGFSGNFNDDAWAINTHSWDHYINDGYVNGSFYPDIHFNATFTPNAVPELPVWAMMILGFAGLGWHAVRKARLPAVA